MKGGVVGVVYIPAVLFTLPYLLLLLIVMLIKLQ